MNSANHKKTILIFFLIILVILISLLSKKVIEDKEIIKTSNNLPEVDIELKPKLGDSIALEGTAINLKGPCIHDTESGHSTCGLEFNDSPELNKKFYNSLGKKIKINGEVKRNIVRNPIKCSEVTEPIQQLCDDYIKFYIEVSEVTLKE